MEFNLDFFKNMNRNLVDQQSRFLDENFSQITQELNVPGVVAYLKAENCLSTRENDILTNELSNSNQTAALLDIIKRKHLLPEFYNGLLKTRQFELADLLKQSNPTLQAENGFGTKWVWYPSNIKPPSAKAIAENESFYKAEIKACPDVAETCGVIENLTVDLIDSPPRMLGFDPLHMYKNFSSPKGLALIINNKNFVVNGGLPERLGTDIDCKNIENLLTGLGYSVKVKDNLTSQDILDAMQKFAKKDKHSYCDSAVVVLLSHGDNGSLYGTDCRKLSVHDIVSTLNTTKCQNLEGKPKIFIIQACRGEQYDLGVDATDGLENEDGNAVVKLAKKVAKLDIADARAIKKIPTEADILIAYATTPGYVSWRNSMHGSWFIQAICQIFAKKAKNEEILHLFTEVNKFVSDKVSSSNHVQVPEPCSRLRKKFYFFPGVTCDPSIYS